MSMTKSDIIAHLTIAPSDTAADIAQVHGASPRAVQDMLHELDDSGHVILRNGAYRLSEAARMGKLGEPV